MTELRIDAAHDIGTAAGVIWRYLHENGPVALTKLSRELDQPKDTTLQGVGWLAREGKVEFVNGKGNARLLKLTE